MLTHIFCNLQNYIFVIFNCLILCTYIKLYIEGSCYVALEMTFEEKYIASCAVDCRCVLFIIMIDYVVAKNVFRSV